MFGICVRLVVFCILHLPGEYSSKNDPLLNFDPAVSEITYCIYIYTYEIVSRLTTGNMSCCITRYFGAGAQKIRGTSAHEPRRTMQHSPAFPTFTIQGIHKQSFLRWWARWLHGGFVGEPSFYMVNVHLILLCIDHVLVLYVYIYIWCILFILLGTVCLKCCLTSGCSMALLIFHGFEARSHLVPLRGDLADKTRKA